jgi:CobQ-like glutamine amidotransferase family enzyme
VAKVVILHLYPETLRLNGESGNVLALTKRAESLGISTSVVAADIGAALPTERPDLIFIGSGTLSATMVAGKNLLTKVEQIHRWVAEGTKVLAVGTGFDLISKELVLEDGTRLPGVALTNTSHRVTGKHLVGEVVLGSKFAGFINSDREISRGKTGFELGTVQSSDEPKLVGYVDGYTDGKVWASNVQGPLLPMNPHLADAILMAVFPKLKFGAELKPLDELAAKARRAISARVGR